jgi:hypothetical protein
MANPNGNIRYCFGVIVNATFGELLRGDLDYEESLYADPIIGKRVLCNLESDSEQYVAEQIWRKQMRYEESDRYVQMQSLQYGI